MYCNSYLKVDRGLLQRSEKDLVDYLKSHNVTIPPHEADLTPLLVSDSKGKRLAVVHRGSNPKLPIQFSCKGGANSSTLVSLLKEQIPILKQKFGKPVYVYFWAGTCDITSKQGCYINISGTCVNTIHKIINCYKRARDYTIKQGCKIQFIGVPVYSVSLYNDIQGHHNPSKFLETDAEVASQVHFLNSQIELLNTELGTTTLKFNADLRDCRKKGKERYFIELLEDGLHPGELLARKWFRRLELNIGAT
ncbi:uncharacterized protein LOC110448060 [Mizuhopecten yessoensis]|uniref:uncharacterized protein LOC110448060 n=1 Tax=Mizuhopecten yessoensis TaxID=6573 RepID=UPI000B45C6A2|nr:uncharacterized protein LOC110448060 [Mizuhopecten yessoensis]